MTGPTSDDEFDTESDTEAPEIPFEAPEADVAEQHTLVRPPPADTTSGDMPEDADPADVTEQRREVPDEEDDYR
jgi:hypothetical protein